MTKFGAIDWGIIAIYFAAMIAIGFFSSRGQRDTRSYFLGNRAMPTFAVALSVLATTLSAATFISVPELTFRGDLSYLILNLGGIIAAFLVAFFFIPTLHQAGTITIYGFLAKRYGDVAMISASLMFLIGRLFASGARLFIAAIAFSLILYGETGSVYLITAIVMFGVVGTLYTMIGGIRAVIWTDTIQIGIVVFAAFLSICLLLDVIPISIGDIPSVLRDFNGQDKLRLLDLSWGWDLPFTLWTGLIASTFVSAAAFSVDQDMVQRMLTTKTARQGGISLITSTLIGIPVVCLFLVIGLLLSIYYGRPDLMGSAAPFDTLDDTRRVYSQFLLNHLPSGVRGLAMTGLFAAAMSSLDSAINAMASSALADLYLPWKKRGESRRGSVRKTGQSAPVSTISGPPSKLKAPRLAVCLMGVLLTAIAVLAVFMHSKGNETLLSFALGVMAFANAPLLGVFSAAILTRRGNSTSVVVALLVGCSSVLLLQPYMLPKWLAISPIAWPWWWVIVSPVSFLICILGKPE